MTAAPFGSGSVSLRLYPHDRRPAEIVETLRNQACHAELVGFDGVMTSEHHGGFGGYLPNPLQAAGWALEATERIWAAPAPLLLPLRPTALVAEEVAWLRARFNGRVGVGVAAGSLVDDFEIMGTDKVDLVERFAGQLDELCALLSGRDPGRLSNDPAIASCVSDPIPVLSAAMSPGAIRRAAHCGAGILFDSLTSASRARELVDLYRECGGSGQAVLIRRVWIGRVPEEPVNAQIARYHSYASDAAKGHWDERPMINTDSPTSLAGALEEVRDAVGADALNLRLHAPGISPFSIAEQIDLLGEVLSELAHRRA